MGYFIRTRWNDRTLEGELFESGRAHSLPRPANLSRQNAWSWFIKQGKSQDVLAKLQKELLAEVSELGTDAERKCLTLILQDFEVITPAKIPKRDLLNYANLLIGVTNFWGIGKAHESFETGERYKRRIKRLKPEHDVRFDELFPLADSVYSIVNKNASDLKSNLIRNHTIAGLTKVLREEGGLTSKDARERARAGATLRVENGKLKFRDDISHREDTLKSFRFMLEQIESITYNEALRRANGEGKRRIIPQAEFDEREINIQNAYKQWRKRNVRK